MRTAHFHLEEMFLNPEAYFKLPGDVLNQKELSLDEKILILKLWAHDQKLMEIATSENMDGPDSTLLSSILKCISTLEHQRDGPPH